MPALIHPDQTQSSLLALKPGEFFVLGSAANADVRLTADGVAPRHARIANDNGLFTLAPLSPKFPVFLNDQYVDPDGHGHRDHDVDADHHHHADVFTRRHPDSACRYRRHQRGRDSRRAGCHGNRSGHGIGCRHPYRRG